MQTQHLKNMSECSRTRMRLLVGLPRARVQVGTRLLTLNHHLPGAWQTGNYRRSFFVRVLLCTKVTGIIGDASWTLCALMTPIHMLLAVASAFHPLTRPLLHGEIARVSSSPRSLLLDQAMRAWMAEFSKVCTQLSSHRLGFAKVVFSQLTPNTCLLHCVCVGQRA